MKKILNIVCLFLSVLPLYSQDISYIQGNTKVDLQIANTGYLLEINNSDKAISIQQAYKQQLNLSTETVQVGQQYFLQINEGNPASVTAFLQNYQTDVTAISPLFLWKNDKKPVYFTGEIIATPQNGVTSEQILALFEENELALQSTSQYNSFVFKVKNYANLIAIQNRMQQSNLVLWSYPNHKADISLHSVEGSQDPRYFEQTYLNYIKAPEAWRLTTTCGSSVRVAVLDGGVPYPIKQSTAGIIGEAFHPDMIDKVVQGYTPVSNSLALLGNPMPYQGIFDNIFFQAQHGQFCAGLIAANHNNGEGIKGVAPNSVIVPVNIFANATTILDLARGIDWAWNEGQADILSNSWNTKRIGVDNPDIIAAITRAKTQGRKRKGCLVVFSSGNSRNYPTPSDEQDGDFVHFPANIDGVLAVGALNPDGATVWNNSCISRTNELDLVAVGVDVITTNRQPNSNPSLNGFYTRVTGTSFSAPQVAGVAAMLLGAKPSLTEIELASILTNTAQRLEITPNGYSQSWGYGIVHARRAMQQVVTSPLLLNRTDDDDFQTWLDKQVTRTSSSGCTPTVTFTMSDALFALGTCTWELMGGTQLSATTTGKTFEVSGAGVVTLRLPLQINSENSCIFETKQSFMTGSAPAPLPFGNFLCIYDEKTLTIPLTGGADFYTWEVHSGSGSIRVNNANGTQITITPHGVGTLVLKRTSTNACGTTIDYVQITISACGDPCLQKYNIFPNPAENTLNIAAIITDKVRPPSPCRLYGAGFSFKLVNIFGQVVREGSLENPDFSINLATLPSSVYYLHIAEYGQVVYSQQVMIEK